MPEMTKSAVRKAEMNRKSLFGLRDSFQSTPSAEGMNTSASVRAPRGNMMPARGQCMILNKEARPKRTVPTIPEIFIVVFIFLYLVSTA